MPAPLTPTRAQALQRTRHALQRDSFPRLQMTLIVAVTGGAGFLASFTLLHLGVHGMALRWPLALGLAYLCFLGLLGLWLRWQSSGGPDLTALGELMPNASRGPASGSGPAPMRSGGGGDFGSGGASGSFEAPAPGTAEAAQPAGPAMDMATDGSGGGMALPDLDLGDAVDAEDGLSLLALLLVLLLALALALASLWVVWTAPALLSEVLVDGALSFTLYRHLRRTAPRHWLSTAVRRTVLPFAITAVFLAVVGGVLASAAPGARSLGEVIGQPAPPR
jgi:hypothetical protein